MSNATNVSNCALYSPCWEREITLLNQADAKSTIVITVFMAIVAATGLVGNAILLAVYSKKKPKGSSDYLIIVLGCVDFLACLIVHPYEVYKLVYFYLQDWGWLCKVFEFFEHANIALSVSIFIAIAVDRYYAVCKPLRFLRSLKLLKILLAVMVPFGLVLSLPVLELSGIIVQEKISLNGEHLIATFRCQKQIGFLNSVFRIVLALFFVITVVLISVLYARVAFAASQRFRGRVLPVVRDSRPENGMATAVTSVSAQTSGSRTPVGEDQKQTQPPNTNMTFVTSAGGKTDGANTSDASRHLEDNLPSGSKDNTEVCNSGTKTSRTLLQHTFQTAGERTADTKPGDSGEDVVTAGRGNPMKLSVAASVEATNRNPATLSVPTPHRNPTGRPCGDSGSRSSSSSPSSLRTAKMLFAVTAVFFISWTPYWIFVVIISIDKNIGLSMSRAEWTLARFGVNLIYLNNCINPLIYAIFNRQFRENCKDLLKKCFCCKFR